MKESVNISATPIVATNRSGHITGGGGQVTVNNHASGANGGIYSSGSSKTFFGQVNHNVSESTSINMGGSINNRGAYNVSMGLTFRW